jgi:hypothetical protein
MRRRSELHEGGEPACGPGSVTPLSVTWQRSLKCWLTCDFISHGFSLVPVSFHALAEQRRNWQIPSRVWADEEARAVLQPEPVSRDDFRHARSSRAAILREEEAGFHVRLHGEGHVTRSDGSVEDS